jgi:hypothetical protein
MVSWHEGVVSRLLTNNDGDHLLGLESLLNFIAQQAQE